MLNFLRTVTDLSVLVLDDWKYNLDMCVSTMEPAWPVFESFKNAAENVLARNRGESQATFDLMVPTATEIPQAVKTPNSTASYELSQPYSPQIFRSQSMNSVDVARPNRKNSQHAKNFVPPTSHVSFTGTLILCSLTPESVWMFQNLFLSHLQSLCSPFLK